MGYHTDFYGSFTLDRPLTPEHAAYLKAFNTTRRMKRNAEKASALADPIRVAVGLPIGDEGGYYVGASGFMGQDRDASVVDSNHPPIGQPALWCQWTPNEAGTAIVWDEGEKFYSYVEWLQYLIDHFLRPWGYKLTGEVRWEGEDSGDIGIITVAANKIAVKVGRIVFDD